MRFPTTLRPFRLAGVCGAAGLLLAGVAGAAENSATVSFLEGSATDSAGGNAQPAALALNGVVREGDVVETKAGSKLELKMKDGSVVRIGPASKLLLKSAYFGASGEKKFSAKLLFGQVWSKVSGLIGGDSKFEVETDNAVAGVRGTTFRVDAKTDHSVLVRVYAGSVAMAAPGAVRATHKKGEPRQRKAGPTEVSKKEWEKIVGKDMQMRVSADGTPGEPTAFAANADAGDDWATWNQALDEK